MTDPSAPTAPVPGARSRHVWSTVAPHDPPATSRAGPRVTSDGPDAETGQVLERGEQRLARIVLVHGSGALAWLALLGAVTAAMLERTGWSPVTVVVGVVSVLGSSAIMLVALRRWARQLSNAAAAEMQAHEHLQEVAGIRSAFLGGISHQLRTPMTSILGFSQTLHRHHRELDDGRRTRSASSRSTSSSCCAPHSRPPARARRRSRSGARWRGCTPIAPSCNASSPSCWVARSR